MTREEQEEDAYFAGFAYGAEHAADDFHGAPGARDLGLYPGNFDLRDQWNHGRQDGACAVRLGHDAQKMLKRKMQGPSLLDPACLIVQLLDEVDLARGDREETWRQIDRVAEERDAARKELASLRALVLALMEAEEAFYAFKGPPKGKGLFDTRQELFAAVTKETP
jgi:hypothetical protein